MNIVFSGNTADDVWVKAMTHLKCHCHDDQCSRLGNTREVLHASFCVKDPRQRWVFSRKPAINPAFAIAEVFWILSGKNDAQFVNFWNPLLPRFAGNGTKYPGAYGYRIRKVFNFDQLSRAYHALRCNPGSRQVVIQIWDPRIDFPSENGTPQNNDIPCNICSLLKVREGKLEWLQIMRSNDLYRGTPYNFVQFTTLQEVLAGWLGLNVGEYFQVSDSLHVYEQEMKEVNVCTSPKRPMNHDDLSTSKERADVLIPAIYEALRKLTFKSLTRKMFHEIISTRSIEDGYSNMLLIAAADSARRRGWYQEMQMAKSRCTNKALAYCWSQWESRRAQHTTGSPLPT
jgi:thymidylate synthase